MIERRGWETLRCKRWKLDGLCKGKGFGFCRKSSVEVIDREGAFKM